MTASVVGRVRQVTVWPVKSMSGGTQADGVHADRAGLLGDRAFALVDRRPLRDGRVLSARNVPGILRWSAIYPHRPTPAAPPEPTVVGPDGRSWSWSDPALVEAVREDLGLPVDLAGPSGFPDLPDSVLVTTSATHRAVEESFGRTLDVRRWRTNLHLDLSSPSFEEHRWEGRALEVGGVVLRLLHPCKRCTIPTWTPGGQERTPELLRWFHREADGTFGINARVEVAGPLRVGEQVRLV